MTWFLATYEPVDPGLFGRDRTAFETEVFEGHRALLEALAASGVVAFSGRTVSGHGDSGFALCHAPSLQSIEDELGHDPAVREGVLRLGVRPFKVVTTNPSVLTTD